MAGDISLDLLGNIGGIPINSLTHIPPSEDNSDDNVNMVNLMTIRHSPYLDDEAFKSFLKNSNNVFSIMSTNIASIRSKYDELKIFSEELLDYDFKFDVICIQESWLGETL